MCGPLEEEEECTVSMNVTSFCRKHLDIQCVSLFRFYFFPPPPPSPPPLSPPPLLPGLFDVIFEALTGVESVEGNLNWLVNNFNQ